MKEIRDHYFYRAKKEGYPARSVYKLIEAQEKFKLLKQGHKVLDLGAAPGSWTKYAARVIGKSGLVVALDLHRLKVEGANIHFFKEDIFQVDFQEIKRQFGPFDCVLSDMAPKTTGRKDLDHYRSIELANAAVDIAIKTLKSNGSLYCKVFDGEDFPDLKKRMQSLFNSVKIFKPKSSRAESVEKFLFCQGMRN